MYRIEATTFPRTARLRRSADFDGLREKSSRISLRFFYAHYRFVASTTARLGMAISRRVSKSAVVRNRIKRQVRESFRRQRHALPHLDVLIIAKTIASERKGEELRQDLKGLWDRLINLQHN